MASAEIVLRGAVTADGRLVLDEEPTLPPGRVEVVLRTIDDATPAPSALLEVLERIWADLDAQGVKGRSAEEAVADVRALRDEWDAHQEQLERLQDQLRAKREKRHRGGGQADEPPVP